MNFQSPPHTRWPVRAWPVRAWLVRANVRGKNRLSEWLTAGYCAVGWWEAGRLTANMARQDLAARLTAAYPDRSPGWLRASVGNLDRFLSRIAVGDLVVTPDGAEVFVGTVTSAPRWVAGSEQAHRRAVAWWNPEAPLLRPELAGRVQARLRTMLTVTDLSPVVGDVMAALSRVGISAAPGGRPDGRR